MKALDWFLVGWFAYGIAGVTLLVCLGGRGRPPVPMPRPKGDRP